MYLSVLIFITGLIFGSFYLVVGTRLLKGESIIKPRSHCCNCNHILQWYDLIPLLSFITLRGKCRYCHKKIDFSYPLTEILCGILFLISYLKYGISYDFFIMLIISSLVVLIFITDFKDMIILDSPLIIAGILIFILNWFYYGVEKALFSLLYGLITFITMLGIRQIGNIIFKKDSLGGGDIKLSFIMGMILNFYFAMIALVLSTFLAFPYALSSILLNKDHEVAFGPFLVSSLFIVYLFIDKFSNVFNLFYYFA